MKRSRKVRSFEEEALLEEHRHGPCEWCGRMGQTDCAHALSRGAGGPTVECNLVALCRRCHTMNHNGQRPTKEDLLALLAMREGYPSAEALRVWLWQLRRQRMGVK